MTKYVAKGRSNTKINVYHISKDCQALDHSTVREATQNEVEYFDLRLCQYCNPDVQANNPRNQDQSYQKALQDAAQND